MSQVILVFMMQGFFRLQSPLDLLDKLEFDYGRFRDDPNNLYVAFDFFVTAEHLPEWFSKAECNPGNNDRRGNALKAVCSDLANGAKHFTLNAKHDAVRHADMGPDGHGDDENLIIELAGEEAAALKRSVVSGIELAGLVLSYWRNHDCITCAKKKLGWKPEDTLI